MLGSLTISEAGTIVGIGAALLAGNYGLTSLMIDRKLRGVCKGYVPADRCVLLTETAKSEIKGIREEGRAACLAAVGRDEKTQTRINELSMVIATAIMTNREIVQKIDALLARE